MKVCIAERLCSIAKIARAYGVSQNYLMKVVSDLASAGYVESVRGRNGRIKLPAPRPKSTSAR